MVIKSLEIITDNDTTKKHVRKKRKLQSSISLITVNQNNKRELRIGLQALSYSY